MDTYIETDVLIIGGGGAGLRAAIAAKAAGVDVTLVYKNGGNSTVVAAGGHNAVFSFHGNSDSVDKYYQDTMISGCGINSPSLVKVLVERASQEISDLGKWGIDFITDKKAHIKLFKAGGHSHPRSLRCLGGSARQLCKVMKEKALEAGVKIISGLEVINFLHTDNKVFGAVGSYQNGDTAVIKSKAAILATGGLGRLYPFTTNPIGMTGEGYVLALEAGAVLCDMEFIQFLPTCLVYPLKLKGAVVTDSLRGEGAILLNSEMERFMTKYSPEKLEVDTRDVVARSVYQEIKIGKSTPNGGVYLDARGIERKLMMESFTNAERLIKAGVDPSRELIEVAPFAHFCCGGVKIDQQCRTDVEGLWAAGEVAGGIHGANRLSSNALTENLVFGRIAGEEAAKWAREQPNPDIKKLLADLEMKTGCTSKTVNIHINEGIQLKLNELQGRLQDIVWKRAGMIRNEKSINEGLAAVAFLKDELAAVGEENINTKNILLSKRLNRMSLLAEVILRAALKRKESRGTHYRDDFAKQKDQLYYRSIEIKYSDLMGGAGAGLSVQ